MNRLLLIPALLTAALLQGQGYTSWFLGNGQDAAVSALGGVCLMGGATEHDEAMRWFLRRANGGDVLVLRASGSDGYQSYFHSELGVPVNSVETIRFDQASAANVAYVHERIQRAEAIWFAGGDQWNYVNYWRGTAIDSLINRGIEDRNMAIGGTSAGMAILGGHYFSAQNGTITSAAALANPFAANLTVSNTPFLRVPYLASVVTDSHYDSPDRRGRHLVFIARASADSDTEVSGIACNEYVAVCVDTTGIAQVYGEWPAYEEYAFFIQGNCLFPEGPESLQPGVPLTWFRNGAAVKACRVPGTMQGIYTFDLNDWRTTNGGEWQDWSAQQGVFASANGTQAADCLTAVGAMNAPGGALHLDAVNGLAVLSDVDDLQTVELYDAIGRTVTHTLQRTSDAAQVRIPEGVRGPLLLRVRSADGWRTWRFILR